MNGAAKLAGDLARLSAAGLRGGGFTYLLAAVALLWVAASAALVLAGRDALPGLSRTTLTQLMMVEFLAIHSGGFLGFVLFWQPVGTWNVVAKWGVFLLLMSGYTAIAWSRGSEFLALFLVGCVIPYVGMMFNLRDRSRRVELGIRWGMGFAIFIVATGPTGTPGLVNHWVDHRTVVWAALIYFVLLALEEVCWFLYRARKSLVAARTA